MIRHGPALALIVLLFVAPTAQAQRLIVCVRHAEKADASIDTALSAAGMARAAALATALRDTKIDAIYVSPFHRTQQTAAPLAALLGLTPKVDPQTDADALAKILHTKHPDGHVLVVGHSDSIRAILKALGHVPSVPIKIDDSEFDHMFLAVPSTTGPPTVIHLRYGK
jgi:broad specificity phosphatase PhoE